MKANTEFPISSLDGTVSDDYYSVPDPMRPGRSIIRHKPRHKRGWTKPESMVEQNAKFKESLARAKREYHDPVLREQWEAQYHAWRSEQLRHGKFPPKAGEPKIRFLWEYVRWQCMKA